MKRKMMISLIVATLLMLAGGGIVAGVLAANGWNITALSTVKYVDTQHEITEDFNSISIRTGTTDIRVLPAEDGVCRVVCHEEEKIRHEVKVENGELSVTAVDTRAWYDDIGLFGNATVTLYLPKAEYEALNVNSSTGDVEVSGGIGYLRADISLGTGDVAFRAFVAEALTVEVSTGDVLLESLSAGSAKLSSSTGDITLFAVGVEGHCELRATTGDTELREVTCATLDSKAGTGDLELHNVLVRGELVVERSSGDVELDGVDAATIQITTDTGDVEGRLLCEKIFITHTNTGSVSVPSTTAGGRCEINTDTGDIRITLAE